MQLTKKYNIPLLILPVLIFTLGYITLLSTSPERAKDQLVYFLIGILIYLGVSFIDYRLYSYYWKYIYSVTILMLIFTYVLGEVRFGSARWIDLGFVSIQPSEFAKITVVLTFASLLTLKHDSIRNYKYLFKLLLMFLPLAAMVFIQPDLGTSIVLIAVLAVTLFYAGLNKWFFVTGLLLVGIFSSPIWGLLKDYQKERILVFLNPALDVLGSGYNVIQALIAVGSGGLLGKGFGHGTQSQLKFLPAYWTDFIFASFSEEWGFAGVMILLVLFLLLFLCLIHITYRVKDPLAVLMNIGVFTVFFVQFIINVGMNLGVMPVTGIPLPLVSYGGSSLFASMILLGIVQSTWTGRRE